MGNEQEKDGRKSKKDKAHRKDKKEKKKKDKGHGRDGVNKEQPEASGLMAENPCPEHAKGGMSKSDVMKEKKRKKKDKGGQTAGKEHVTDSTDENLGLEHVARDKGEGGNDIKSKKGKSKRHDGGTASDGSAGDIVSRDDKKRKRKKDCSVTLEEGEQVGMSKTGEKKEGKNKRRKGNDNSGQGLRQNTQAGDGKNGNKEENKNKDENEAVAKEEEKVLHKKDKGRRVSFTDAVEVLGVDGGDDEEGDGSDDSKVVHGRRFTGEEDAKLMEAIKNYAEMMQLGEKGFEIIRSSRNHPEVRGCWAEIAKSFPHRTEMAVYKRARILLYRSDERKWTPEEYEIIRRSVEKNGTSWKKLATDLGKSEIHVKDTWRRIKQKNKKKGPWSQDEYQNLFDLVNMDLRVKAHQENINTGHRQIRENISWEAISDKLTTRSAHECCLKWYNQLTSPLVKQGIWADTDDYLLVEALQKVDAVCIEDVDWENLLDHRSGEACRQRWNQMVRMLGGHREKPFIELVEVLSRRYCSEMLDYRK